MKKIASLLLSSVVCLQLTVPAALAAAPKSEPVAITTDLREQLNPDISGDKIVWNDFRNGDSDIYMYDLTTRTEIPLIVAVGHQELPKIDQDKIVWVDSQNSISVYMYDLTTKTETLIAAGAPMAMDPQISGNKIVWLDFRTGKPEIFMYDLATRKETQITTNPSINRWSPNICGDKLTWINSDVITGNSSLSVYDLTTGKETIINSLVPALGTTPAIYENRVVWVDARNGEGSEAVYMYDIGSKKVTYITDCPGCSTLDIYGDKIVFGKTINGITGIFSYDLTSRKVTEVTTGLIPNGRIGESYPAISQKGIVWHGIITPNSDNLDIYFQMMPTRTK